MPPCSPFSFINKLVESNSFTSDLHPYYPVPPCRHGSPAAALAAGDAASVLGTGPRGIARDPARHLLWELAWLLATGLPRKLALLTGREQLQVDGRILTEGLSSHHSRRPRTRHLGRATGRRPESFDSQARFQAALRARWRRVVGPMGRGPGRGGLF
jgi:hypothetical protein